MVRLSIFTLTLLSCLSFTAAAYSGRAHRHARRVLSARAGDPNLPNLAARGSTSKYSRADTSKCKSASANTPAPAPTNTTSLSTEPKPSSGDNAARFPSLKFAMPSSPPDSVDKWWEDVSAEYAFLGFSYDVSSCQGSSQLDKEFDNMRNTHNARYVRLYGACDQDGYYNKIVEAAWKHGLGVHALIWFGFDGSSKWKSRRDALVNVLTSNPKAKFVTRAVQFGSEVLFDSALDPGTLAQEVRALKKKIAPLGIKVTVSDMAYGYQKHGGAQDVLDAIDVIDVHTLPWFSPALTNAAGSWKIVLSEMDFFLKHGNGKKIYLSENGWPWKVTASYMNPSKKGASTSKSEAQTYYEVLDQHCEYLKAVKGGGVGWFAHVYSDNQDQGYGVLDANLKPNYKFTPRTSC